MDDFRKLEVNGGIVRGTEAGGWRLTLPAVSGVYADAQIDDYGGRKRRIYPWLPGTRLRLEARFSRSETELVGTAGFGFWNAPYGDPTVPLPALPQAAWFFFGSPPTDLPLALRDPGRGWFASTIHAGRTGALALVPFAPVVLLLNQVKAIRQRIWPPIRRRLGITFQPVSADMRDWHRYQLDWTAQGCRFWVDGETVLNMPVSPGGPLGFVCWIDNQYLTLTIRGRLRWGTLAVRERQELFIKNLELGRL